MDHRNTPSQGLDTSPAQRLLSRRTRTLLPTKASLLQTKVEQVQQGLRSNQKRQSAYYNRSAKYLDTLKLGDCVRIQPFGPHTLWRLGKVLRAVDARSYEVQLQSGGVLRRNRKHLRLPHGQTLSESMDIETRDGDRYPVL